MPCGKKLPRLLPLIKISLSAGVSLPQTAAKEKPKRRGSAPINLLVISHRARIKYGVALE